jgi:Predicted transcriptional regulator with C-terminal CBS domains
MIGERIKQLRVRAKLSQDELAKMANVTQAHISKIELGEREPNYETLALLASALKTTRAYLMGDTDSTQFDIRHPDERSESVETLDKLIKAMAAENPDITVRFRELQDNIDELEPEEIRALADGYAILTGMATKAVRERMRTKSRHGEL